MNLKIINETPYKKIRIICDNKITILKKNETTTLNLDSQNTRIQIDILDKNRTFFFILALVDISVYDFLTTESAQFMLHCSTSFDIVSNEPSETLVLKDLEYEEQGTLCQFKSVYVKIENSTISNINFFADNVKKVRNKTIKNLLLFVSGLPVIILSLLLFNKYPDLDIFLFIPFLVVLFCTIPSVLKSIKIWKYCKDEYINQFLLEKEAILRQNNGEEPPYVPTGFIEKKVSKILDTILKKGE